MGKIGVLFAAGNKKTSASFRFFRRTRLTALLSRTFRLSQLTLKASALSQMPAMVAGSSKRNQGKADSGELVDLAEILWLGVNLERLR